MKNMNASVDYFSIKGTNQVGNVAPNIALNQCLNTGAFCDLIHRDALGTLWLTGFISALNQNLASAKTSGVDITFNYIYPFQNSWGSLAFSFFGTWVKEFKQTPVPGLGEYDCAGLFGQTCGTPTPDWRHKARVTWQTPWSTDVALTWRHISKVTLDLGRPESAAERRLRTGRPGACGARLPRPGCLVERHQAADDLRRRRQRPGQGSADRLLVDRGPGFRQRQHLSAGLRCTGP